MLLKTYFLIVYIFFLHKIIIYYYNICSIYYTITYYYYYILISKYLYYKLQIYISFIKMTKLFSDTYIYNSIYNIADEYLTYIILLQYLLLK